MLCKQNSALYGSVVALFVFSPPLMWASVLKHGTPCAWSCCVQELEIHIPKFVQNLFKISPLGKAVNKRLYASSLFPQKIASISAIFIIIMNKSIKQASNQSVS